LKSLLTAAAGVLISLGSGNPKRVLNPGHKLFPFSVKALRISGKGYWEARILPLDYSRTLETPAVSP